MYVNRISNFLIQYSKLLLSILAVIGIVLIVKFLSPRSEVENQVLFGLSFRRFTLGAVFVFFWIVNVAVLFWGKIQIISVNDSFWIPRVLAFFYFFAFASAVIWVAMIPPLLVVFKFLRSIREQLDGLFLWLFILCAFMSVYIRARYSSIVSGNKLILAVEHFFVLTSIFAVVFFLYAHFAALIGWVNKGKYAFWDLLAGQFLQGRLYIPEPPYTHDLTLYEGKWYVPMPPLPAVLMIPLAYWIGFDKINASFFSIVFSALNGVLMYSILREMNARKWTQLSTTGIFILVILFLFGTPHLWVGISGRGWYVSQILTVFFLGLAVYASLRMWSPWWVGVFIGLAMTARPNGLMTWPFLFAITMQLLKEKQGQVSWQDAFLWSFKTALPVVMAVGALLTYNYMRFDDFLDFGYTTVNAGSVITTNVQTWGIFHPHFIPRNFQVMLFEMPFWNPNGRWPLEPSTAGMSMFLTTPALFYLFRRYPKHWWVTGSWIAVLFNIGLLSMYHNTGAHQFGYRYILDILVLLIAMFAVRFSNQKMPWHFVLAVLLSIVVNLYGADWFMNG